MSYPTLLSWWSNSKYESRRCIGETKHARSVLSNPTFILFSLLFIELPKVYIGNIGIVIERNNRWARERIPSGQRTNCDATV